MKYLSVILLLSILSSFATAQSNKSDLGIAFSANFYLNRYESGHIYSLSFSKLPDNNYRFKTSPYLLIGLLRIYDEDYYPQRFLYNILYKEFGLTLYLDYNFIYPGIKAYLTLIDLEYPGFGISPTFSLHDLFGFFYR